MNLLRSLVLAFSTFSRIPMPRVEWTPESMRYTMCFFPLVGVVIGLLAGLWVWLSGLLGLDALGSALGITLVPLLVTGGIHMDGFCDTVDALASHAAPEKAREILHDPHVGSFAVVGAACYVLCYFVFAENVPLVTLGPLTVGGVLVCLHVLSRCLSSMATVAFPTARDGGMLASERGSARKAPTLVCCTVLACAASAGLVFSCPPAGMLMIALALACLASVRFIALRRFGGMSGDLAGFFLQNAELLMLAAFAVVTKVVV